MANKVYLSVRTTLQIFSTWQKTPQDWCKLAISSFKMRLVATCHLKTCYYNLLKQLVASLCSGEASPAFGHANANFSVFIDRIRNQFLKK